MKLSVNGAPPITKTSPGLIPNQPLDPFTVGRDTLSAAGDYSVPNPFNQTILKTRVEIADH